MATRLDFSRHTSFKDSTSFAASSMGCLYFAVPMMSSRYSSNPSSCSFCALGFICAMDSTSPYKLIPSTREEGYLEDKESFMVQVDAFFTEHGSNFSVVT